VDVSRSLRVVAGCTRSIPEQGFLLSQQSVCQTGISDLMVESKIIKLYMAKQHDNKT